MSAGPRRPGGASAFLARRFWILAAVAAALAIVSTLLSSSATSPPPMHFASLPPQGADPGAWPTFLGNENRSGFTSAPGPETATIIWFVSGSNLTPPPPVRTAPVGSSTRVYYTDALGGVFALNLTGGGDLLWRTQLGSTTTAPDLNGGILYVGDAAGRVTALDAASGQLLWRHSGLGGISTALAVSSGMVIAVTATGNVSALNATDGRSVWSQSLGDPGVGAPAVDSGLVVAATRSGRVVALDAGSGVLVWSASVGSSLSAGPSTGGGRVVVADQSANVTAISEANGTQLWRFVGRQLHAGDSLNATPATANGRVYVETDLAHFYALNATNGSVNWQRSLPYTGNVVLTSPAVAPNGVYLIASATVVEDLNPLNGSPIWVEGLDGVSSFASPALMAGNLVVADDTGEVRAIGPATGAPRWAVTGVVRDDTGRPVPNATVNWGTAYGVSRADGAFTILLPNGSFDLHVEAAGFYPVDVSVTVSGPVGGILAVLHSVPLFPLTGVVRDANTNQPVPGLKVSLFGPFMIVARGETSANGTFALAAPNGTVFLTVSDNARFHGSVLRLEVSGGATGVILVAYPRAPASPSTASVAWAALGALVVVGVVSVGMRAVQLRRARIDRGLSGQLLSPFARFTAMRLAMIPLQTVGVLTILYDFGTFLPAAALAPSPCTLDPAACPVGGGSWGNLALVFTEFFAGYERFIVNLFGGDWGLVTFGALRAPATTFLGWWGPDSLELAGVSLLLSLLIAYPLGLLAGFRRDSAIDYGTRVGSLVGLLVPSFLVILLLLTALYLPFTAVIGDPPFGTLPTSIWFLRHGGIPGWIGVGGNTTPTGLPLIDGLIHGDLDFERVVASKTLFQAFAISIVYVAVFLRYARHAVGQAVTEPHITAARARGLDEKTLLWRHAGRRVWPVYLLVFGVTLPAFLGTQALVEAMSNDSGLGTLLLAEMTHVGTTGFGFSGKSGAAVVGNLYQVMIFILLVVVLVGNLASEVLARYLDPRLGREEPR